MDSFQSVLGDAAGGALCNVLSAYGSSAPLLTAISLVEPTPVGEAIAVSAGLAGLAAAYGCTWDPNGQGPPDGPTDGFTGCKKFSSGKGKAIITYASGDEFILSQIVLEAYEFGPARQADAPKYEEVPFNFLVQNTGQEPKRISGLFPTNRQADPVVGLRIEPRTSDAQCEVPAPIGPPEPPTYVYTDPESGCEINVNFKGWGLREGGNVSGIWEMTPNSSTLESSGGIIGGCNFAPLLYVDGGGGGGRGGGTSVPIPDPVPPSGEEPWWAPLARGAAAGIAATATQAALDKLFETPYAGGSYELKGVCERDPNGQPMDVTKSTNFPPAPGIDAVLHRLDALAEMFQFDKDLRQPTCQIKPTLTGERVTVNFISDKASSGGERPLRKVFRYRDQTASPLKVHLDHWVNFTWQAGPVIVVSQNLSWGSPKVWAASIEEGKRVISHAAQVAGVDLTDPAHKWLISGTDDPRYGRTGTMRLDTRGGLFDRVTKRPSPSGLPYGYSPES